MARITRPLTNNEILKAKPREKDYTLHDGDGLFLLVKASGTNSGASVINDREAAAAQIGVSAHTLPLHSQQLVRYATST